MSQYLDRNQVIELYKKYQPYMATRIFAYEKALRELTGYLKNEKDRTESGYGIPIIILKEDIASVLFAVLVWEIQNTIFVLTAVLI